MSRASAIQTVIICVLAFLVLGGACGWLLGVVAPGYYHTMFPESRSSPVEVGLGLGVTQGFGLGVFIGLIILGIDYLKSTRKP